MTARGYNAPEPLLATLNLVGATPFTRPSVAAGIFSQPGGSLAVITGPETVHDLHVSDPAGLLAAVAGTIRFSEGLESVAEIVVPQAAVKSGRSAGSSA